MVSKQKEDVCSGVSYHSKNKIHAELQTDSEHVVLSPGVLIQFALRCFWRDAESGGILSAGALSKHFGAPQETRARLCVRENTDTTWSLSSQFPIAAATSPLQLSDLSKTHSSSYSSRAGRLEGASLGKIKVGRIVFLSRSTRESWFLFLF